MVAYENVTLGTVLTRSPEDAVKSTSKYGKVPFSFTCTGRLNEIKVDYKFENAYTHYLLTQLYFTPTLKVEYKRKS